MEKQKHACPSCGKAFKNLELHVTHKHTEVQIEIHDDGTDHPACLVSEYRNIGTPHEVRHVKHEGGASASGSRYGEGHNGDKGEDFYEFNTSDKLYTSVFYYPTSNKIEYVCEVGNDDKVKTKIPNWTAEIHKPESEPIIVRP